MKVISVGQEVNDLRLLFFETIFGDQEGYIGVAARTQNRFKEEFFKYPQEIGGLLEWINKKYHGRSLYFCPQLLAEPIRKKEHVKTCTCVWADLDECDPGILAPEPSIVMRTSPGRHQALWLLEEPADPADAEDASHRIAYKYEAFGADKSGWDLTQLLRIPVTYNTKYQEAFETPVVEITKSNDTYYPLSAFHELPAPPGFEFTEIPFPEDLLGLDPGPIFEKYKGRLDPKIIELYQDTPEGDWSASLWRLENLLFECGVTREETFVVCWHSACNKYKRDKRPPEALWKDVCKADTRLQAHHDEVGPKPPTLLTPEERKQAQDLDTFADRYVEWCKTRGDAAWQYHEAGAFTILSAVLAGAVKLKTSFGTIIPNVWFMILADTCQPLDSKVLTPAGWKLMGDLQVGDQVIGSDGLATVVTGVAEERDLLTYKVTFKDGSVVECSQDHLWTVRPDNSSHIQTLSTTDIADRIAKGNNVRVPLISGPVEFSSDEPLPVNPYILGVWLGEGCKSARGYNVEIATADEEIVRYIEERLPAGTRIVNYGSNPWSWHIKSTDNRKGPNPNPVRSGFRELGILPLGSHERYIPEQYLTSSISDRTELLQGILDGEGSCSPEGFIRMQTTSSRFAKDVQALAKSLGCRASVTEVQRKTVSGKKVWQLSIRPPADLAIFKMKRKLDAVIPARWKYLGITKIEPTEVKTMKCISVAAPDGLYVTDDFIVTHNTLTRKSTAMDMAMDLLREVQDDAILATDGSVEGLMSAIATRPGKPGIFWKDEFSGFLEAITKKDYMAGMAESLTKLYDGKYQKKQLRREVIELKDPILIMLCGGIRSRTYELLGFEHIVSGFAPRFIFIMAESDMSRYRPLGPMSEEQDSLQAEILQELVHIRDRYITDITMRIGGQEVKTPASWEVRLTPQAWDRYNAFEMDMVNFGIESNNPEIVTPMMDRLSKSGLKIAMLLAAAEQDPQEHGHITVDVVHILKAISYIDRWRMHTLDIINNVGKTATEKKVEFVFKTIRSQRGGVPRSKVMQNCHLTSREADWILETLEQRALIRRSKNGRTEIIEATDTAKKKESVSIPRRGRPPKS